MTVAGPAALLTYMTCCLARDWAQGQAGVGDRSLRARYRPLSHITLACLRRRARRPPARTSTASQGTTTQGGKPHNRGCALVRQGYLR